MALAMLLVRLEGWLMAVVRRAIMFSLEVGSVRAVVAASAT